MLLFCGSWISIQSDWKASSDTFSMTVYFRESLIYKPTPPEARGVGTYAKTYPGMLGLKSISLPLIILVSETPIMLNSKFNSSNRWTWKFSRFRLRLLIQLFCFMLLHAARVFGYFVVIEIAFMDNQAQITELNNYKGRVIITCVIWLIWASGKLIFFHENKVFNCHLSLTLAETRT